MRDHDDLKARLALRYERLAERNRVGFIIAVGRRFVAIKGLDAAGLLALELFTVVIPLMLLGFSYASDFSAELSFGDLLIRRLDLDGASAEVVRSTFGNGAALRSTWTVIGLAGFLLWGLGTAPVVARIFADAWHRDRFSFGRELCRGFAWFLAYLVSMALSESAVVRATGLISRDNPVAAFAVGLLPVFVLWSITPMILLRDGAAGWSSLARAGLAGVLIDGIILRVTGRIVLPALLDGWVEFGPIGVAMALMTWCGIQAFAWVATACVGAVLWERAAPPDVVVEAQTAANRRVWRWRPDRR